MGVRMKYLRLHKAIWCLLPLIGLFPFPAYGQVSAARPRVLLPVNESVRVVLKGSTPPLARPEFDSGPAPDSLSMESIVMVLQRSPEQETALQQLLASQQTKSSPNFHKWLTPEEFGTRFGPADADIKAVTDWLTSHGFDVKPVLGGRTVMEFSGTAGQVKSAFHTEIHKYIVRGQVHWANNGNLQIPLALAPVIRRLLSLNNFYRTASNQKVQSFVKSRSSGTLTPISPDVTLANGGCASDGNCYGVGPADFATIYDVNPLYTASPAINGTGQTIAIASSTNIYLTDTQNFRQLFNLPVNNPQINVIGADPGVLPDDEGLTNLQVQWAGAVAPNATIELVVTQSTSATEGANLSAISVVDGNLAPILTLNYTDCEPATGADGDNHTFYYYLWEQAASQGITVVAPTGDSGAAGCDSHLTENAATGGGGIAPGGLAVNATASTEFNVAVGGTDFNQVGNWSQYWNLSNASNTLASAISYIPEETWNDTCAENGPNGCSNPSTSGSDLLAGGGGCSSYSATPAWQATLGVCTATGGTRALPDISLFSGDGNNGSLYLLCQGDANSNGETSCNLSSPYLNIQGAGGTAASAAAFAGIMALVNQYNNGRQGIANYVLYPLAASSTAAAFHDITQGSTSVACVAAAFLDCSNQGTGYGIIADSSGPIWSAAPGYDLATGIGSVDVNNLVTRWSSINFPATTTTIVSANPASSAHGQAVTFSITVTSASGTPTGNVALMVNPNGAGAFAADLFPLANGSISASTTNLPGGTYSVVAHYAGDGTFAPSDSAPFPITVTPQGSQTGIVMVDFPGGLGSPPVCAGSGQGGTEGGLGGESYGAIYFLQVVVDNPSDQPNGQNCYPIISSASSPTGTVTLTDSPVPFGVPGYNPTPLGAGTYTLNGRGYLEIATLPASLGTHWITATYSGDNSYSASSAGTPSSPNIPFFGVTIIQGVASMSLIPSATLVSPGTSVTLTATLRNSYGNVASGILPPSGLVTFLSDGSTLGTAPLVPSGGATSTATLTITVTKALSVTAQYPGDTNYGPTNSGQATPINIGNADFSIASSPASVFLTAGQPGTGTITLTPILNFTGIIALACPAASSLPPGMTCSISPATVTSAANGKPVTAAVTLNSQAPSVIMANAIPPRPRFPFAAAGGTLAFAFVMFFLGGSRRKQLALASAAILIAFVCGSCANAVQGRVSSDSALSLTSSSIKSPMAAPVTITAAVSADHVVSGTVNFFDNGTQIAQGVSLQVGRAAFTTSTLVVGTHPITASYSGDSKTNGATVTTPLNQVITGQGQLQITATSGNLNHTVELSFTLN